MKPPPLNFEAFYAEASRNGVYKPERFRGHGVRIVNMGELFAHEFIGHQQMERIELSDAELERSALGDGDLLFGRRSVVEAGAGKCSLVVEPPEPLTFESSIIRVRLRPDLANPRFFFYYFASPQGRGLVGTIVSGAAVKGIRGSDLGKLQINLPSLPVQDRISNVLKAYDDLIENNRRRMALLEAAARHLYREWFVRLRFPGHEHTQVINGVPDGWERKNLGQMLTLKRGYDLPESRRAEGHIPIVSSSGITGFHNEKKAFAPGIVTGRYGTIGEVFFIQQDYWPLNTALYVCDFKGNPPAFLAHLLKYALQGILSDKAAVPGVNRNVLHHLSALSPPKLLIDQFAEFADLTYQQIHTLESTNRKLRAARDLLLPRLMSGEIAV